MCCAYISIPLILVIEFWCWEWCKIGVRLVMRGVGLIVWAMGLSDLIRRAARIYLTRSSEVDSFWPSVGRRMDPLWG